MAAVVVVVAVVGVGVYWFGVRDDGASAATAGPTTSTVAASLTTMEKTVTGTGTLTPTVQESVGFAVSGTVTSVAVAAGDTVTAGQTLATVDTLQLNADLLSAKATLAAAAAKLADAQDADDGTTTADAQIAALAAQVDVAQAAVDTATAAMADATLVAPVAGLVTAVDLEVGDVVGGSSGSSGASGASGTTGTGAAAGAQTSTTTTSTGTSAVTIVGTDAWQVSTTVGESDVALIAAGDQVEMTSDDSTDVIYGTVGEVGLVATSTSGVAAYPVVVDVTGNPADLHDGVSVDVSIIYERRTDVLTVPAAAVTTADGESVVQQAGADGNPVSTVVTVGETSGNLVEITSGLAEGDEVLVTVFTPAAGSGTDGGSTDQRGTFPGGGEMPDFSGEMPDFSGGMPAGGQQGGPANG
ncbi:RND transporter [Actinomycetota bacterium]|nr:RND transporter [Actinomycetota bacterium]